MAEMKEILSEMSLEASTSLWIMDLYEFSEPFDQRLQNWMNATGKGSVAAVNEFPAMLKKKGEYVTNQYGEEIVPIQGESHDGVFMQKFCVDGVVLVIMCNPEQGRPRVFRVKD